MRGKQRKEKEGRRALFSVSPEGRVTLDAVTTKKGLVARKEKGTVQRRSLCHGGGEKGGGGIRRLLERKDPGSGANYPDRKKEKSLLLRGTQGGGDEK